MGVTRGMTFGLTYNTDLAEAEVNDRQINLTRFSSGERRHTRARAQLARSPLSEALLLATDRVARSARTCKSTGACLTLFEV